MVITQTATAAATRSSDAADRALSTADTVQGARRIGAALAKISRPARVDPVVVGAAIVAWIGFGLIAGLISDSPELSLKDVTAIRNATPFTVIAAFTVAVLIALAWASSAVPGRVGVRATARLGPAAGWLLGSGVWFVFWEFTTAKTNLFATPYFASPQAIADSLWGDKVILAESLGNSLQLLAVGFMVGLLAGLGTGVVIGWWQVANYWVHPVLVFIGPVPTLAWVPVVFVLFPSAYSGAVFLIALSVWFPVTVLTRAGILSVPRSYYDVARTLGANGLFLIVRVSIPASLPSILTGVFMALSASFVSLTVAENFGVNSGLGWYLNWQKSWGDFPGLYGGIVVLVLVCGALLTLLFRLRGWALRWEKELTRW